MAIIPKAAARYPTGAMLQKQEKVSMFELILIWYTFHLHDIWSITPAEHFSHSKSLKTS